MLVALMFVIFRQYELLTYILWGDEAETIVASKMIASGLNLYSEIFNHHGPLTFLPGYILEKFGNFGISGHRVFIVLGQWLILYVIYSTPLIKSQVIKNYLVLAVAYYIVMFLPEMFGHMYKYQVLVGLLTVVLVIKFLLPIIFLPNTNQRAIAASSIIISSLPFLAIPYIAASLLFFLAFVNRSNYKQAFKFIIIGIILNLLFLYIIGSFSGYIADHFYMNTQILPAYQGGGLTIHNGIIRIFNFFTSSLLGFFFFCFMILSLFRISLMDQKWLLFRSLLIVLGVISFLYRSTGGFHALPFYYSIIIIPVMMLINVKEIPELSKKLLLLFSIPLLISLYIINNKTQTRIIPKTTEFAELVKKLTSKDDKIIAYSFKNHEYIYADRLPASGNFFYLPWQEKYNEKPILGIKIDSCIDINKNKPKIMLIDKWKVWGNYTWDSYGGCIQKILDKDYIKMPGKPFYIRKNSQSKIDFGDISIQRKMKATPPLSKNHSIKLFLTSKYKDEKIKRIAIMFGTHKRKNLGFAELRLLGIDGSIYRKQFSLESLVDNRYQSFDLNNQNYISGEIISISGHGVSTWESKDSKNVSLTCIIYEYTNGMTEFTPGCPVIFDSITKSGSNDN